MTSAVMKRSVIIGGHKTSVSLEDEFWMQLKEIADAKQTTVSQLLAQIDERREHSNLSSAIRVYVLEYFRNLANTG
jgi:predicted DNA-binding ribbon-helix-helix protein